MKPSLIHYVFGHGLKVSMLVGATVAAVIVIQACEALSVWTAVAVLVALPLGSLLGGLLLWPWVFAIGCKISGSPFHEGDLVHVLVGTYRDRVGRIYEIWPSRNEVRVEIDEQAKKDVTDVFGYNEVCREPVDPSPERRPFQFSVRGMLLVVSLFALSFGLLREFCLLADVGNPSDETACFICLTAGLQVFAGTIAATIERVCDSRRSGIVGVLISIVFVWLVVWFLYVLGSRMAALSNW